MSAGTFDRRSRARTARAMRTAATDREATGGARRSTWIGVDLARVSPRRVRARSFPSSPSPSSRPSAYRRSAST